MNGKVLQNKRLNSKYCIMKIENSQIANNAEVGQFIMLQTQEFDYIYDPLLRRPFGICDINKIENSFSILYMLVGKGTKLLSNMKEDSIVSFSEPLGNSFQLTSNSKTAIVGGGIGIAPLLWLSKSLKEKGNYVDFYFGGQSQEDIIILEEFQKFTNNIIITTNDGSLGKKGLVTEPLIPEIVKYDKIYTCGPKGMLRAVSELAVKHNKSVEVSLDERMACGLGACLGCIIYIKDSNDNIIQQRCCVEGPIFDGSKVVWESVCK